LRIDYTSMLAQAQKQAGLSGMTHFLAMAGEITGRFPAAGVKINPDEAIDQLAEIDNIPPKVGRSDDEVARLRAEAAEAERRRRELAGMGDVADIAKTLGQTKLGDSNLVEAAFASISS
jgi:hypothetical protein